MSELGRRIARSSIADQNDGLAPPVDAVVDDALSPPDQSLPVALCTVAGEFAAGDAAHGERLDPDTLECVLEPICGAVRLLEGYVRLRLALAGSDRATVETDPVADWLEGQSIDRDTALLASDHLHASAYVTAAKTPISDAQLLEVLELVIQGSTALAQQTLPASSTDETVDDRVPVEATLAGLAGALGVTAVGGSSDTRETLRRYGHELVTALASQSMTTSADPDPRATAVGVLFDGQSRRVVGEQSSIERCSPSVRDSLEHARAALEMLVADDIPSKSEWPPDDTLPPLVRLEQATRLPFQNS